MIKQEMREARKRYPYIVAWGILMQSYDYYVDNEVWKAIRDKAPVTAIYRGDDGWNTIDDCVGVTRSQIENIITSYKLIRR